MVCEVFFYCTSVCDQESQRYCQVSQDLGFGLKLSKCDYSNPEIIVISYLIYISL